jgi:dipeptidase E
MRRIVAMGGGGFSGWPGDPALDSFVLDAADAPEPSICLLPTASGDPEEQIARFRRAYADLPCRASHISLFRLGNDPVDLRDVLLEQDVIYVGGGSLLNLLAIWRAHGVDDILREAWECGIVLCGISAGSMCWFEAGVTKSHGAPRAVPGLGFLPGSNSVHYHSEPDRRPAFEEAVAGGAVPAGYGVDDGVALVFEGTDLVEAVSGRDTAGAWRVQAGDGGVTSTPLEVRRLPPPGPPEEAPLSIAEYRAARHQAGRSGRVGSRRAELGD